MGRPSQALVVASLPAERDSLSSATAYDSSGLLLHAQPDGTVDVHDLRPELSKQMAGSIRVCCRVQLQQDLGILPTHLALSPDGGFLAMAGVRHEDEGLVRMAVLDLRGKSLRHHDSLRVPAQLMDEASLRLRPGLALLQLSWHPCSAHHFVALTSDRTLRMYHVHQPEAPEQQLHLQMQPQRGFGLGMPGAEQPVAFAFGSGPGWHGFAVHILCASGAGFVICPVAPFGSVWPVEAVRKLHQGASSAQSKAQTTAWVHQAFGHVLDDASLQPGPAVAARPHALPDALPELQGPLQMLRAGISARSGKSGRLPLHRSEAAQKLLLLQQGPDCLVRVVGTNEGRIFAQLQVAPVEAAFAAGIPQCLCSQGTLQAVRTQVPHGQASPGHLLLLDEIRLPMPGGRGYVSASDSESEASSSEEGSEAASHSSGVMLAGDPQLPERFLVASAQAVHAVSLQWLPLLARHLSDLQGDEHLSRLPGPDIRTLHSHQKDSLSTPDRLGSAGATAEHLQLSAVVSVGSALLGGAIAALGGESGEVHVFRANAGPSKATPLRLQGGHSVLRTPQEASEAAPELETHVAALYREALDTPAAPDLPACQASASEAEGQQGLSAAIEKLRGSYMVHQHRSQLALLQRLRELQRLDAEQRETQGHIAQAQLAAADRGQSTDKGALSTRLERCAALQDNLQQRAQVLAELHYAAPRALNRAETQLQREDLPELATAVQSLQGSIEALVQQQQQQQQQSSRRVLTIQPHSTNTQNPTALTLTQSPASSSSLTPSRSQQPNTISILTSSNRAMGLTPSRSSSLSPAPHTPKSNTTSIVPEGQLQRIHAAMSHQKELLCCAKEALGVLERSDAVSGLKV